MRKRHVFSRQARESSGADVIQERLMRGIYVHHDHGGREHGHDWDDWRKADRAINSQSNKPKRPDRLA